jgi:hypothetical protein
VVQQLYKPIIKQCTVQTQTTCNDIIPITYIQEPVLDSELIQISNTIPDYILLVEKLVVLQNSNNTSTSRCTILEEKCKKLQDIIDNQAILLCQSKQSTKEYRDLNFLYRKDLQDKDSFIKTLNKKIEATL